MQSQTMTQHKTQAAAPAITLPAGLRRIVLTGFMGAGKSTIGRLLAERLGWNFLDLDAHLESRVGQTVPEIFAQHGESHFRRLESSALAHALGARSTVLALGGGAPESLTNQLLLEQTPGTLTVFLDAPFPVLFDRCVLQDQDRPVLADPTAANERFARRHPIYKRLARITLDTSALDPATTVDALLERLQLERLQRP